MSHAFAFITETYGWETALINYSEFKMDQIVEKRLNNNAGGSERDTWLEVNYGR